MDLLAMLLYIRERDFSRVMITGRECGVRETYCIRFWEEDLAVIIQAVKEQQDRTTMPNDAGRPVHATHASASAMQDEPRDASPSSCDTEPLQKPISQ